MSKILVVDDNPSNLRLLKYMLSKEGYEVITAKNGIEGLKMALQEAPDLIILDVMLPGMDGFEVCHRLRGESRAVCLPVLMLSAKGQPIDRETGLKVGANEYLTKPVNRKQLLESVRKLLAEGEKAKQEKARQLFFLGVRGGVGASTVVTSTAVALVQKGHSVILVDLNPLVCEACFLMGLKTAPGLSQRDANDIPSQEELAAALIPHSSGVKVLCGAQILPAPHLVNPESVERLFQELQLMAEYVLVDLPAAATALMGRVLQQSDIVSLITSNDATAAPRVAAAVSQLAQIGVERQKLNVIVVNKNGNSTSQDAITTIGEIPVLAVIPYDAQKCAEAETQGTPIILAFPDTPMAQALHKLADKMREREK